jgi:hypothetical protein
MTFISMPESPSLFTASGRCYILLVKRTTEDGGQKRYELLWELISTDIIGGPWVYGTKSVEMTEASVGVLTEVISELGVAIVRFLKVHVAGELPFRTFYCTQLHAKLDCSDYWIGNCTSIIGIPRREADGTTPSASQLSMSLCTAAAVWVDRADISLEIQDIRWVVEMLG